MEHVCKKLIINQKRKKVRSHAIFRLDYKVDKLEWAVEIEPALY